MVFASRSVASGLLRADERASERAGREGRTARRRRALEEPAKECGKQAPARRRWQEQPARRSLSVGDLQLQYDFGGILGWRAEDRKVSLPEPLPELCLPSARTPVLPGYARLMGSEWFQVCIGYLLSRLFLWNTPEARLDGKSVPRTPVEPLEALQRAEVTVPARVALAADSLWLHPAPRTSSALGKGWRVSL